MRVDSCSPWRGTDWGISGSLESRTVSLPEGEVGSPLSEARSLPAPGGWNRLHFLED